MSTGSPSTGSKPTSVPSLPPDEEFWEKYSPHYEFPLSSIGSIAMHIGMVLVFIGLLWLLAKFTIADKAAVPMRAMTLVGDGDGEDGTGEGGGLPENDNPLETPMDPVKVQDVPLEKIQDIEKYFPKLPSPDDGLRPEQLPTPSRLNKLNDDVRRAILDGMNGKRGKGPGEGEGASGVPGKGSSNTGDASSTSNRAMRWELIFSHLNGKEYLRQLSVMKAKLVIAQPPDWKTLKVYSDLTSPVGTAFSPNQMPPLYFIDDECGPLVAHALGLDFDPPNFIAFFPKDIEEELAAKERAYRGRKESEIFSTKFKILIRDGKPSITVIDQIPVKR